MRYQYTSVTDPFVPGGKAWVPLIDVNIGEFKLPIRALIDTGSPVTIIHSALAVAIDIIPSAGRPGTLLGIGGDNVSGFYQSIPLYLGGCAWVAEVFMSADLRLPYCLLGQTGFFTHFRVDFELPKRVFTVTPMFQ